MYYYPLEQLVEQHISMLQVTSPLRNILPQLAKQILLNNKLQEQAVMRATSRLKMQRNIVAKQVSSMCWSYYTYYHLNSYFHSYFHACFHRYRHPNTTFHFYSHPFIVFYFTYSYNRILNFSPHRHLPTTSSMMKRTVRHPNHLTLFGAQNPPTEAALYIQLLSFP